MGEAAVLGSSPGKEKRSSGFGGLWDAWQVGRGITVSPVGPPALGLGGPSTDPNALLVPSFLQPARGTPRGLLGWDAGAVGSL